MVMFKNKVVLAILALGLLLLGLFYRGLYPTSLQTTKPNVDTESILMLSTSPDPLDQATLLPSQPVELNFNSPLPSSEAFKYRLDPSVEVKIELINDNKTVRMTPVKSWSLGGGYTLFVLPDTSFVYTKEAHKPLGKEYLYHFKTINYKGA